MRHWYGRLAALALVVSFPASADPAPLERLAPAIGTWTIRIESRNGPEEPFTQLETTSQISEMLGGAFLQEQVVLPTPAGRDVRMTGVWGYDRFRERYRFAWLDDLFALFDVMEGEFSDGVLTVDNVRSGTSMVMGEVEYHSRMIWGPFGADGFPVESQVSTDGGKTWWTQTRGRYSRAQ